MIYVIKRDGTKVPFDNTKIRDAILKANKSVPPIYSIPTRTATLIAKDIENEFINSMAMRENSDISVEEIQDSVEDYLMINNHIKIAKEYIKYRYKRNLIRDVNKLETSITTLLERKNEDLQDENANKSATVAYTQRDLIAGETSKYMSGKFYIPEYIMNAHNKGILHFHDLDYYIQNIFNCCLVNIDDMLHNGTVINDKMIESPTNFQTACTVMTQIITNVSSSQYGGTSVDIGILGEFLSRTEARAYKSVKETIGKKVGYDVINDMVQKMVQKELESGIQTIQYQVNTMATSNGQSPFVTLFMYLREDDPYLEYTAKVFEEMFKQRILGIKNKTGVYVSPSFPKLVYVVSPMNNFTGGKYDYLTKLACECIAKRMMPDIISEKQMEDHYEGNVFSPMGCRSFLSPWKDEKGEYKFNGRLTA